jgi:hypothetical protein
MTREEALQAMIGGEKVTHQYFSDDEFIYMKGNNIYDENDFNMKTVNDEFWIIRKTEMFDDGWSIYKK